MVLKFKYIADRSRPLDCREFQPNKYNPSEFLPDSNYHFKVLHAIQKYLLDEDYTFIMTWSIEELPSYGSDIIAYCLGDEHYQIPAYTSTVRAVLKTLGCQHWHETHGRKGNVMMNFSEFVKRKMINSITDKRYTKYSLNDSLRESIFTLPLGYYNYEPQAYKSIVQRDRDVFFAGAISTTTKYPQSLLNFLRPLAVARKQMVKAYRKTQIINQHLNCFPNLKISSPKLAGFDSMQYSKEMSTSKIALCPRGSHAESFRLFEAAQSGCIIICDPLPPFWYYENCPAIIVHDWKELPEIIRNLCMSPDNMERLSLATHEWFNSTVHPEVVGKLASEFIINHQKRLIYIENKIGE